MKIGKVINKKLSGNYSWFYPFNSPMLSSRNINDLIFPKVAFENKQICPECFATCESAESLHIKNNFPHNKNCTLVLTVITYILKERRDLFNSKS